MDQAQTEARSARSGGAPSDGRLAIVVVGASGDLARRKIYPALFALYCQGYLPADTRIFGFARSPMTSESFRSRVMENLTCRYTPKQSCAARMDEFLSRCDYVAGQYASRDAFLDLFEVMRSAQGPEPADRLFYLAIPPDLFRDVAHAIAGAGMVACDSRRPWSRVVIEKPFGRDRASSDALGKDLARVFSEEQTYRIDHYLGKELVQNLLVLRFANLIFEPIWNRDHIRCVRIVWKEDLRLEGRAGYFDAYGIVRDVIQNHLLQMLSLVAMERPSSLDADDVRDAKVRALRHVRPASIEDLVVGQYTAGEKGGRRIPAYREEAGVAPGSKTPTYAAMALQVDHPRWQGVPFLISAGKGLDSRTTEIRVRFRDVPVNVFCRQGVCPEANELVIRIQPDEAIRFRIVNKVPGLGLALASRHLDLRYQTAFAVEIPDAYESLLLDAMRGEKGLFIRGDELAAAWDILTPALTELERRETEPTPYAFGTAGPAEAEILAERHGVRE